MHFTRYSKQCVPAQNANLLCWCTDWFLSQSSNCFLPPPCKCQVLLAGGRHSKRFLTVSFSLTPLQLCVPPQQSWQLSLCSAFWIFLWLETPFLSETPLTWHTKTRESSNFIQAGGIVLAWVWMAFVDVHFTARSCVALQTLTVERAFCIYAFPSMFTRIAVCCKKNTYMCVSKPLLVAGKPQHSLLVMVFSSCHSFLASNIGERLFILLGKAYCDSRKHMAVTCLSEAKRKIAVITDGPQEQLWSVLLMTVLKRRM